VAHSCLLEGVGTTYKAPPVLVMVVVNGTGQGKGSFPGCHYLVEGLSSLISIYGILHIVIKWFLIRWCLSLRSITILFRRVPQA
jgi:hypothetical protein